MCEEELDVLEISVIIEHDEEDRDRYDTVISGDNDTTKTRILAGKSLTLDIIQ